jgi:pimeloyl-ACP methyl ester carboxylesterase
MDIKNTSYFKNPQQDLLWFENWVSKLASLNNRGYERFEVPTSLGKTHVWALNTADIDLETLVIFPGARTSVLFWDFDNGLDLLMKKYRIFLVETNGLPNLSDGNSPDIKSNDYGIWAAEVMDGLQLEKAFIAGASFGGLICMKLCLAAPERVKAAFLLNAGCLQPFSMSWKNLYYNLWPIIAPSENSVGAFLNQAIFCKPNHQLSAAAEKLLLDYELFALTRYKDNTQKPYYMKNELLAISTDTYVLEGNRDLLFPFEQSIKNARSKISSLKEVIVYNDVGHGIETYPKAMSDIGKLIEEFMAIG